MTPTRRLGDENDDESRLHRYWVRSPTQEAREPQIMGSPSPIPDLIQVDDIGRMRIRGTHNQAMSLGTSRRKSQHINIRALGRLSLRVFKKPGWTMIEIQVWEERGRAKHSKRHRNPRLRHSIKQRITRVMTPRQQLVLIITGALQTCWCHRQSFRPDLLKVYGPLLWCMALSTVQRTRNRNTSN